MYKTRRIVFLFFSRFFRVFADAILFVLLLTRLSNLNLGSVGLIIFYVCATIPAVMFSLPAGAFVERKSLQIVMAITIILRITLLVGLFFA